MIGLPAAVACSQLLGSETALAVCKATMQQSRICPSIVGSFPPCESHQFNLS